MNRCHFRQRSRILVIPAAVILIVTVVSLNFLCIGIRRMDNTKSFELYYKWEFYSHRDKEIISFEDSIGIIEKDGILLYLIKHPYEKTKVEIDSAGDVKGETLLSDGVNYTYFFQEIGKQTGMLYDSLNSESYKLINIDTFIKSKISFKSEMFYSSNDSLLSVSKNEFQVIEKYIPKIKTDDSFPDSSILIYSYKRQDGLNYSLAPKLDSVKKMKLSKVKFIYNKKLYGTGVFYEIPRREYVFEIRENKEKIPSGINSFFEKVQHVVKTKRGG